MMTSPITPSLLIPPPLKRSRRKISAAAAATSSLHNILTHTSGHLKRVRSGLISPNRDKYHQSGKVMKERYGLPLEGTSSQKKIFDPYSSMVFPILARTGRLSRPPERYCEAWDRNISVPFAYYPAISRMNDTIFIAWMIAFRWNRKRPVPYCETALLITKPLMRVNIFFGTFGGILFRIAVFLHVTFGTAQVFAAAKVLKLTERNRLFFSASFRSLLIVLVRSPEASFLHEQFLHPRGGTQTRLSLFIDKKPHALYRHIVVRGQMKS
jgi:hypothetical protein